MSFQRPYKVIRMKLFSININSLVYKLIHTECGLLGPNIISGNFQNKRMSVISIDSAAFGIFKKV